jgi:hypothetical protein
VAQPQLSPSRIKSDTLCRLSTGGGFATRQLYTDSDEVLLDAMRPIVLTGIEDVVTRGDLADRSIPVRLDPIPEERRRSEREIWAQFEAARPRILGALLDAMAHGLRHLATTRLDRLPRMADFAVWVTACEGAVWKPGIFLSAHSTNRAEMDETVIEADAVATAVRSLMAARATLDRNRRRAATAVGQDSRRCRGREDLADEPASALGPAAARGTEPAARRDHHCFRIASGERTADHDHGR